MNVTVFGIWHLGCVTAACTASADNRVIGLDFDQQVVADLRAGRPPISEPGLTDLIASEAKAGRLSFTTDAAEALRDTDVLWVTFDTPVNERDEADVEFVRRQLELIRPHVRPNTIVLISSQVPVGFTRRQRGLTPFLAYSPENLRLGKAIEVFRNPERVILGVSDESIKPKLAELFRPFGNRIEWMSIESAEMTKHAINAFLATSVTFANELARLCEVVGADAKEVERGLKSEGRIGPKAYLSPGGAFAGGTLARDLRFLTQFGKQFGVETPLFDGVIAGNERHKTWTRDKVRQMLQGVAGPVVAVLGLTYKPGTDTLRRSTSVELCRWMRGQGCVVKAHDPAIRELPEDLRPVISLSPSAPNALKGADLAVLATEWPDYRTLTAQDFLSAMRRPAVIDPNWFLAGVLGNERKIHYVTTGRDSAKA
ncbi:MAG TPA: nucleotide sugar dehydrogenase [Tepidisphaeraceae bacterium]|jgi:UDPglucose 6-dehydrogenase